MDAPTFFEKSYQAVISNEVNLWFIIILTALFGISVLFYFSKESRRSLFVLRVAPSLLVGVGILGTFVGIFAGLLDFDVKDIDASIPPLLDGLKIAFSTSIAGMSYSIILRTIAFIIPTSIGKEGTSAEDIYEVLSDIRKSISGDEESSMVSQILLLRTTTRDQLSELKKSFDEFAENMAENNTNALIEALERVMKDFNTKINEQFGDNFKRLNEAVEALLEWQQNYKEHVETMTEQFERSLGGIEQAKNSISTISDRLSTVPEAMNDLRTIIDTMQRQNEDLERHLEAFSHLRQEASEAFPIINQRIEQMTTEFSSAVSTSTSKIEETVTQQSSDLTEMARTLRDGFDEAIRQSNENLAQQIQALDDAMQDEVRRVVEVMGGHLTSLSSKFVEDYGPLTEALQQVLSIARDVRR